MNYYKMKKQAMKDIQTAIATSKISYIKPLCFKILQKYAFPNKFTLNYLNTLEEMDLIIINREKGSIENVTTRAKNGISRKKGNSKG